MKKLVGWVVVACCVLVAGWAETATRAETKAAGQMITLQNAAAQVEQALRPLVDELQAAANAAGGIDCGVQWRGVSRVGRFARATIEMVEEREKRRGVHGTGEPGIYGAGAGHGGGDFAGRIDSNGGGWDGSEK